MATTLGLTQKNYVSAISPLLDKREIFKGIIDGQRDDEYTMFLEAVGGKAIIAPVDEQTGMSVYHSWYDNPISQMIDTTSATVTGSGTATVVVTVLPAGSQNKLIVGDELRWSTFTAIVTATTAAGFTATSISGGNLTLTAGTSISPFSRAYEEGSDAPTSERFDVSSITNQTQIIRSAYSFTDVQMRNGVEFEVNGQDSIIPYEAIQSAKKHKLKVQGALFMGELSPTQFASASPTITGANGRPIQTTRGMTQYVKDFGVQDTVATAGTIVYQDLADMTAALVAARAPRKYGVAGSNAAISTYYAYFKNLGSSGMVSGRIDVTGSDIDLVVSKVDFNNFDLNFFEVGYLNNQQVFGSGATLLSEAKKVWFMPMGKVNTVKHGVVPFMRQRYSKPAYMGGASTQNRTIGDNGMTMEIISGGLAPQPTNGTLTASVSYTTNVGMEVFNPQAFGSQQSI